MQYVVELCLVLSDILRLHFVLHSADFAAFMAPMPRMNRLGDLSDLPSNPTGLIVTLIMLGLTIVVFVFGVCEHRGTVKAAQAVDAGDPAERDRKNRFNADVANYTDIQSRYRDANVPYLRRTCIGTRIRWLLGGSL